MRPSTLILVYIETSCFFVVPLARGAVGVRLPRVESLNRFGLTSTNSPLFI
jgi:hypothetical protein